MSKRKICVVVTARPSYSRVKTALTAIQNHPELELQLVVAGSALLTRYGSVIDYISDDGFEIKEKVYVVLEGENPTAMAKTTGLAVMELATVFNNLSPDVVVVIADRFETLAVSIAAAYQNIPVAHIQGGEVTGNIDEKVRHANTKLADIHLVASEDARERVLKMGEDAEYVFNSGCPSMDIAAEIKKMECLNFDPINVYGGVGSEIDFKKDYIVVMQHPVTTEYNQAKEHVWKTLNAITELGIQTCWFWPNVDAGSDGTSNSIRTFRETSNPQNIRFFKNIEPRHFLMLLMQSKCLIGNSSAGVRECAFLGVPVVNIGTRQHKRMRGANVLDVIYDKDEIKKAIQNQITHGKYEPEYIYGKGDAGIRIANILSEVKLRSHKTINY
uniref:UDP-N-acetylglucosamine 2-epimerase n=1 Tax=Roseivirga sp. TaxID=1964215 RepID=UPI00404811E1